MITGFPKPTSNRMSSASFFYVNADDTFMTFSAVIGYSKLTDQSRVNAVTFRLLMSKNSRTERSERI